MPGPRHGGPGGPGYGRPPAPGPRPIMRRPRRHSYLGTGLSAMTGAAIGTTIANSANKKSTKNNNQSNYNNSNYYEVFAYCPNCGTKRNGNETVCSNCGASLVK